MKNILIIFTLILFSTVSFGQTSKGSFLIGGSATYTDYGQFFGSKLIEINVAPNIGYFAYNNVALGLKPSVFMRKREFGGKETIYSIGPYLRYYFLTQQEVFNIILQADYQTTFSKVFSNNGFGISGGPVIFLSQNIAFELSLGYTIKKSSNNFNNQKATTNTFQSGIGLQIHLAK